MNYKPLLEMEYKKIKNYEKKNFDCHNGINRFVAILGDSAKRNCAHPAREAEKVGLCFAGRNRSYTFQV
jgi:hypothetical protein